MDILDKLGINPILLSGYLVNFLILFFVLNKFVFKKALKNIDERKKLAQELVLKSDSAQKALDEAQKQFNEIVQKANEQAMQTIGKADVNAKKLADEITLKAQNQAQDILKKAQENIEKEHTTLKTELEKEIGLLVIDTVERVIGNLPDDQKKRIMSDIDKKFV